MQNFNRIGVVCIVDHLADTDFDDGIEETT